MTKNEAAYIKMDMLINDFNQHCRKVSCRKCAFRNVQYGCHKHIIVNMRQDYLDKINAKNRKRWDKMEAEMQSRFSE
jgi:hypothetical protein